MATSHSQTLQRLTVHKIQAEYQPDFRKVLSFNRCVLFYHCCREVFCRFIHWVKESPVSVSTFSTTLTPSRQEGCAWWFLTFHTTSLKEMDRLFVAAITIMLCITMGMSYSCSTTLHVKHVKHKSDPECEHESLALAFWSIHRALCWAFLCRVATVNFPMSECKCVHCPAIDWCPVQGVFPPHAQCSRNNESTDFKWIYQTLSSCPRVQSTMRHNAKTSRVIFNLL